VKTCKAGRYATSLFFASVQHAMKPVYPLGLGASRDFYPFHTKISTSGCLILRNFDLVE